MFTSASAVTHPYRHMDPTPLPRHETEHERVFRELGEALYRQGLALEAVIVDSELLGMKLSAPRPTRWEQIGSFLLAVASKLGDWR